MTFEETLKARYSVRRYEPRPVPRESLARVLDAGRLAPSACNNQPWRFVAVDDPEGMRRLATCYARDWFAAAPAAIVLCGDHSKGWKRGDGKDHTDVDVAIAADHMTLAAAALGLGTCWVCAFDAARMRGLLALPSGVEPVVLLPIGYPAAPPSDRHLQRRPLDEVVTWGLPG